MRGNSNAHKLNSMDYEQLMHLAIEEARLSGDDVPVGAVIVDSAGNLVSKGHNRKELKKDPTAHAEIEAIRSACDALGDWRLVGHTLVVTLEPCVMCAGAILASRISRVSFGARNDRFGAGGSTYDLLRDSRLGSQIEVVAGVLSAECSSLIADFFRRIPRTRGDACASEFM